VSIVAHASGTRWVGFASDDLSGLSGARKELISANWLRQHIQVGPLGSKYPDVMYGMEGDTPSYLSLIPVSILGFHPLALPDLIVFATRMA
jgi:hypothetical protein